MDFFYGRMSGNSLRAALGLAEAGAKFTAHLLDIKAGDNKSPEYLALNPMGKIPALADGPLKLWESNAINLYVAEKNPQAKLLPASAEARAGVHRWLFFQAAHVTPACISVFRQTNAVVQAYWKPPPDPQGLEAGKKELGRYLPVLEQALDGRDWLEGDFSLADLAYAPHLWLVRDGGFDLSPHPRVAAWLERLLARPAWQRARDQVFGA